MSKTLQDLNEKLFDQLDRLSNTVGNDAYYQREFERTKAIAIVSKMIIDNAKLALDAEIACSETIGKLNLPRMIEHKE